MKVIFIEGASDLNELNCIDPQSDLNELNCIDPQLYVRIKILYHVI